MSLEVTNPFELYFGQDGRPIGAGSLYIGVAGLDPQINPIDVFYDREMTVPAMQPLNISGGYVWNCYAPTKVFSAAANYSLKVLGKNGEQVFYCQSVESPDEASQISYLAPFAGAVIRKQADKNAEFISVKDFGAIGDGTLHTVQEWYTVGATHYKGYANLAAVQAQYPHVTSSTDSIDWAATQKAVNVAPNVFCPKGKYVLNKTVKTLHNTTPYDVTTGKGVNIYGDGVQTRFTRNDVGVATRIYEGVTRYTTQASDLANSEEACFAVHSPYTYITDMVLAQSRVGIYIGQDYAQSFASLSNAGKSNIQRLAIDQCGTGILFLATGGNHYINVEDIHFMRCQIDVHQRAGNWWGIVQARGDSNNNRNVFTRIRSARSIIGLWNECGNTNNYDAWHAETMPSAANTFPKPHGLPSGVTTDTCVYVFSGSNQLNRINRSFAENCEWVLYNDGFKNTFTGNGFNEKLITLVQRPLEWSGTYVAAVRGVEIRENTESAAFSSLKWAGAVYIGGRDGIPYANGTRIISNSSYHEPANNIKGSYTRTFQIEVPAMDAGVPSAPVTIWERANEASSTTASIDITIVGRSATGTIVAYSTKMTVTAYRSSTWGLQRYAQTIHSAVRNNEVGTYDPDPLNALIPSLQLGGTDDKDLQIVLNCLFPLAGATLFIKQHIMKI